MSKRVRVTQVEPGGARVKVLLIEAGEESGWLDVRTDDQTPPMAGDLGRARFDGDDYAAGLYLGHYRQPGDTMVLEIDRASGTVIIRGNVRIEGTLSVTGGVISPSITEGPVPERDGK